MSTLGSSTSLESNPRNFAGSSFKKEGLVDKNTKKVVAACSVGALICYFVAQMFAPELRWIGSIAGFAGGYVSYRFRDVLRAIPTAFRAAQKEFSLDFVKASFSGAKEWFSQPHPIVYSTLILGAVFFGLASFYWGEAKSIDGQSLPIYQSVAGGCIAYGVSTFISMGLIALPIDVGVGSSLMRNTFPPTFGYKEALGFWGYGVGFSIRILVVVSWRIVRVVFLGIFVLGAWGCHLFRLIHSSDRVICGVYGSTGGTVSWLVGLSYSVSGVGHVLLAIFGVLIASALGVVGKELVSKRWLKVPVKVSAE